MLSQSNKGKAASLNLGISYSKSQYVCVLDADTCLKQSSLSKGLNELRKKKLTALGGRIEIVGSSFQRIEYRQSFLITRKLIQKFNSTLLISGAFGFFNKKALLECGGYSTSFIGEDLELIFRLRALYPEARIGYDPNLIAYTPSPINLRYLFKQRTRWQIGLSEVIVHYKEFAYSHLIPFRIRFCYWLLLFELISPYLELIGIALLIYQTFQNQIGLGSLLICFSVLFIQGCFDFAVYRKEAIKALRNKHFKFIYCFCFLLKQIAFHYFVSFCRLTTPFYFSFKARHHLDLWGFQKRK